MTTFPARDGRAPASGARSIPEILLAGSPADGARHALLAPGRPAMTLARLRSLVEGTGERLRALGVGRDDRVALLVRNGPEAASAFLAIASTAACAPLNPAYRREELEFYLGDLEARAVVVAAGLETPARDVAAARGIAVVELDVRADDPAGLFELDGGTVGASAAGPPASTPGPESLALVLHTSGTTARPKMVPLTHANLAASARSVAATLELTPDDRCLNVMPLFHIHGLVAALLASLASGGSVACAPGFSARAFLRWVDELGPTWYTAVPTVHQSVLVEARRTTQLAGRTRLRLIRSSSASLPPQVAEELEQTFGVPVIEAYGMTEAAHQMASNPVPPGRRKLGAVGPAAGPEIAILAAGGGVLPAGVVGEVAIRGENVFSGYAANPDANAVSFTDGWFRTGDEGVLDGDGYLYLRGRIKELINRAGEKISPREVDEALLDHPAVAEAVTFALPDARVGEEVAAAVVLRQGLRATERDLQQFVAGRLADFKVPRAVILLDEIPKGSTGKVQRVGLAERLALGDRRKEGGSSAPSALGEQIARAMGEILDVSEVGLDDDFFALGGDSLGAAQLMERLAVEHARPDLPLAAIIWAPTPALLAREVESGGATSGGGALVPIAPGAGPPLFLVHGHSGDVVGFALVARHLPGRLVYGLQLPPEEGLVPEVESLALRYLHEVRMVRPAGPYHLGGHCSGGVIALEMARRLIEEGEEVAPVVAFDPPVASESVGGRDLRYLASRLAMYARRRELLAWLGRKVSRRLRPRPAAIDDVAIAAAPGSRERFLDELSEAARRASVDLRFPGSAFVVASDDYQVARTFWRSRVGGRLEWHRFRGLHEDMLRQPHVERVARVIRRLLR